MLWLAIKMILYEKGRFFISLIGTTCAVFLALGEMAIYLGMMGNATAIIRNTDVDIWVASKNIQNFDFANPFPEQRINQVRSMPEILWTEKILLLYGFLKLANGGREQVQIVGFNPDTNVGGPWTMVEGKYSDVKGGKYMILDKTSEQRLGKLNVGSFWELNLSKEENFKLVGLSDGIKSFTTIPMIFISYNIGHVVLENLGWGDQTFFIVAKVKDKENIEKVASRLREILYDNDVFTKEGFIKKSVFYWTVQTGMGMAFFLTALLAILIGGAIVGQTIYSSTLEHLREFGTLKALGAKNREIYLVIFIQAGINSIMGFLSGSIILLLLRGSIENAGVSLYISPVLLLTLFLIIFTICILSAYFSVSRIRKLDPVTVFRV